MHEMIKELQLLTILFLPVTLGLFLRPLIFAFDSYATINGICHGNWSALAMQPITNILFGFFPCSFLSFKVFMFFSLLITLYIIYKIMLKFFDDKISLYSLFFLLALSPIILFEFSKFENELWAYPLIVLGIFYLFENKYHKTILAFALSLLFWVWPYYLTFIPSGGALELKLFGGLSSLFLFVLVIPFIFLIKNNKIRFLSSIFLLMFLFNAKFFIFLVPLICLGIGFILQKAYETEKYTKTLWLMCFFLIISVNVALFLNQPQQNQFDLIQDGINLAEKEEIPIFNDWSYGHWLEFHKYETKFKSGGNNPDYNSLKKPFVGLTDSNLLYLDCVFVSSARNLNLWICK